MKKFFSFITVTALLLLFACNDNSSTGVSNESSVASSDKDSSKDNKEERNKQTISSIIQSINNHDANAFFANCAADMKDYGDGSSTPMNLDSTKMFINTLFTAFPDFKVSDEKIIADGDLVMLWAENSGTWKGDFMGQKANGKTFKFRDVDIFRLNDEGKITEHHNIQTMSTFAQQLGMKM
jgi:steroid delta-isomerase-like uncharacterized protein